MCDPVYSPGAAADSEVGRRADSGRTETGRGAGPSVPLHVPWRWGGVRLSPRLWLPQTAQHLPPWSQGVCLGRGPCTDDCCCLHQGRFLLIRHYLYVSITYQDTYMYNYCIYMYIHCITYMYIHVHVQCTMYLLLICRGCWIWKETWRPSELTWWRETSTQQTCWIPPTVLMTSSEGSATCTVHVYVHVHVHVHNLCHTVQYV